MHFCNLTRAVSTELRERDPFDLIATRKQVCSLMASDTFSRHGRHCSGLQVLLSMNVIKEYVHKGRLDAIM